MGSLPVLKPREVVALLMVLGFSKVRQRGRINSFVTLMVGLQQWHFMLDVMCHRLCFDKLQKILG
ncbi:hypothetical protein CRENPOLYSF1_180051 [Crenothrix polyspora]|uniref:Uncharacterized protein n=1 Tax=Crenothrix polyspora TaxID=360316 RepID=A0A1R4H5U5_9GAMM|nr:hypothetical protein CRENPOLYSF1_180051 [Crenothrix polyspora]